MHDASFRMRVGADELKLASKSLGRPYFRLEFQKYTTDGSILLFKPRCSRVHLPLRRFVLEYLFVYIGVVRLNVS